MRLSRRRYMQLRFVYIKRSLHFLTSIYNNVYLYDVSSSLYCLSPRTPLVIIPIRIRPWSCHLLTNNINVDDRNLFNFHQLHIVWHLTTNSIYAWACRHVRKDGIDRVSGKTNIWQKTLIYEFCLSKDYYYSAPSQEASDNFFSGLAS